MFPIRFKPYVGKNYRNTNFRILILGEKHYLNKKDFSSYLNKDSRMESMTIDVINRFLNYKKGEGGHESWMTGFTRFSNVFKGEKQSDIETISFWEECAFYNYVQYPATGPRRDLPKEKFQQSIRAFKCVIDEIKPDFVVF